MQFIADTGFVAGFWDRNKAIRDWARGIAGQHAGPHLTAEAVLVEASYLVGPQRIARAFVAGDYQVDFSWDAQRAEVLELLDRYSDYGMDVADACIVLLAAANPGLKVLTVDRKDFSIYRTPAGKPLACEFGPR